MASVKIDGLPVRILTPDNYALWSIEVRNALRLKGWEDALDDPADANSGNAQACLVLLVDDTEKGSVNDCVNASEAWELLEEKYKSAARACSLQLKHQLDRFFMVPGETLEKAAGRVKDIWAQLAAAGIARTEDDVVQAFLVGLPKDLYQPVVLPMLTGSKSLTFSSVMPKLKLVESYLGPASEGVGDGSGSVPAFMGQQRGPCYACGKYGHYKAQCPNKQKKGKQSDQANITFCF